MTARRVPALAGVARTVTGVAAPIATGAAVLAGMDVVRPATAPVDRASATATVARLAMAGSGAVALAARTGHARRVTAVARAARRVAARVVVALAGPVVGRAAIAAIAVAAVAHRATVVHVKVETLAQRVRQNGWGRNSPASICHL